MLGLFGTLNLGTRSLQTQRQGIEVAGHNMANVNNPAYARQRVSIQTSVTIATQEGLQGTGADASRISQIRNLLIDDQIINETSVSGSLEAQQRALQYAQADLGQQIDRGASGAEGSAAAQATGSQHGIAESLSDLFNSFQSLSTQPASITERDIVLKKASQLAERFQQTDSRLAGLHVSISQTIESEAAQVNGLLADIAKLNEQVGAAESLTDATANDLRDTRQAKLEELAKFVKFDVTSAERGAMNLSIGGVQVVAANQVVETLETYDAGGGQILVRAAGSDSPMDIHGGSIHGNIQARDFAVKELRDDLSALAGLLITEVNQLHESGYSKTGTTGAKFFEGTGAADIKVNQSLADDPALLQASGDPDAVGNNEIVIQLAQLADRSHPELNNQTFNQRYAQTVAGLGQSLSSANEQMNDQTVVETMLKRQRDSISGVSLDEEMTDLVKYQKAFEASARLISTVDEMLDTILSM